MAKLLINNQNKVLVGSNGKAYAVNLDAVSAQQYPLDFTAAAGRMLKLMRYGKCEQRNLPKGYTQVEYIWGNGSTSYLNTGIVLNTIDLDIEVDYQYTATPGAASPTMVWGYMGNQSNLPRWGFGAYGGQWLGAVNQTSSAGSFNTSRHKAVMRAFMDGENPMMDGTLDGVELYAAASLPNQTLFTSNTLPVYLFARNNNGAAGNFAPVKIFAFKAWKAGVLISNLIPCKNGNAVGFYDTVTGNFLTGTALSAGSKSVPTPTPSDPVNIVCNNGAIKFSPNMANVNAQTASVGYYISAQGVVTADTNNWVYQAFIPCLPNTTYTLSMSQSVYYVTISEYSTASDSGFVVRKTGGTGSNTSLTITTGATTNFIRFGTNIDRTVVTLEEVLAINWMLIPGSSAVPYTPYVEGGIYIDGTPEVLTVSADGVAMQTASVENILSVGDYKDEQDIISGLLTHKVGIKVLDGTEGWAKYNNVFFCNDAISPADLNTACVCTHYVGVTGSTALSSMSDGQIKTGTTSSTSRLFIQDDSCSTDADLTAKLAAQYAAGTPVIVLYPLATSTVDEVTPQPLNTVAGQNTITDVAEVSNPELYIIHKI